MGKAIAALALAALGVAAACMPRAEEPSGHALYQQYCAACHGTGGQGDGPAGAGLAMPDLTILSARNNGVFPLAEVMSQIDGYTRGEGAPGTAMPEMGHLLDGPMVRVDTGDGIATPTPAKLLALAEYLETLQRPGAE